MNEKDRSAPKEEAEIVVMPAMIEAGLSIYLKHDSRFEDDELVVENIYIAMQSISYDRQEKS